MQTKVLVGIFAFFTLLMAGFYSAGGSVFERSFAIQQDMRIEKMCPPGSDPFDVEGSPYPEVGGNGGLPGGLLEDCVEGPAEPDLTPDLDDKPKEQEDLAAKLAGGSTTDGSQSSQLDPSTQGSSKTDVLGALPWLGPGKPDVDAEGGPPERGPAFDPCDKVTDEGCGEIGPYWPVEDDIVSTDLSDRIGGVLEQQLSPPTSLIAPVPAAPPAATQPTVEEKSVSPCPEGEVMDESGICVPIEPPPAKEPEQPEAEELGEVQAEQDQPSEGEGSQDNSNN